MAKKISDEQLKLSIIINGNQAQKELYDLEKSTRDLNSQQKELRKEKQLLEKQGKKETERYKAVTAAIRENNATLKINKARMNELQAEIGVTGLTMGQLTNKANQLKLTLRGMIPGSADYIRYENELKKVSARIDELKGKGQAAKWSIGGLADGFNRYAALGASVIATGTGVVLSLQKMIDYNGKLAGAQSNVRKTVGLTKKEVDELTKSFGMFQTRTSRIDLLSIAEEGGRIGIAKDQIQEFVGVMDKANVALGDSFEGGPEEVAEKLGKIKFLFEDTKNMGVEQSYMAIGSAINELGANGLASERNIANFTNRIGALTDVLKPTVAETLGLGAAFEESGIEAEVSSRAYNIFMKQAATEAGKFGKVMGKSRQEVEDLINANPLEFMLQFSEGLKGMNATDVAKTLDYLGLNADGANKAIGAMGNNTARFRELLQLSNESFAEGTSLIDEYNIKNNDLEATLSKIKKTVTGWFSSEGLVAWMEAAFVWIAKFIGATEDADDKMEKLRERILFFIKVLTILTVSYISYNAAVRLTVGITKSLSAAQKILNAINGRGKILTDLLRGSTLLLSAAYNTVRGNTVRANAAMKLFNTTVKTNPIGLLLSIIVGITAAVIAFRKSTDDAEKSVKRISAAADVQNEHMKELSRSTNDLKSKIDPLIKILKDEDTSLQTRKKAYEALIKISPDFIDTVDAEFKATDKLNKAYDDLIKKLDEVALAKARQAVRDSRATAAAEAEAAEFDAKLKADAEAAENERKRIANEKAAAAALKRISTSTNENAGFNAKQESYSYDAQNEYEQAKKDAAAARQAMQDYSNYQAETIKQLEIELKKHKEGSAEALRIQAEIDALIGNIGNNTETAINSKFNPIDPDADKAAEDARKKRAKEHEDRMKDLQKQQDENYDMSRRAIDARLALMEEGFEKEEALESENHRRKIEDLKAQLIAEKDILEADKKINDPKSSAQDVAYWTAQKAAWLEKNKQLYELIELQYSTHELRMAKIAEDAETERINRLQDSYDAERTARETAHNYDLAALGENDVAKKKLQEKFDKNELELQEEHLQELIDAKLKILEDKNNAIDLNLLTPQQRAAIEKDIADLKLKISEIAKAKADLQGGAESSAFGDAAKNVFGDVDILGFTAIQWEQTFDKIDTLSEKLQAVNVVVGAMQNLWGSYNEYVTASENAQLNKYEKNADAKKRKLKWQLDNGYINQAQYNRDLDRLEMEYENKKADLEYKQAKRKKAMALVDATINTAKGITSAIPNVFLMALAAAAGALQITTIQKQPLPAKGYEEGMYPDYVKREQDGKVFKSTYGGTTRSGLVTKPTYFLTGENGPEMIIDSKAYRRMSPETKNAMVRELRGIKGFENGYYNDAVRNSRYEVPAGSSLSGSAPITDNSAVSLDYTLSVINRNSDIMERAINEGFIGYFSRDPRELKKLQEEMDRIKQSRKKAEY